jgi:squalene synthase HpnC
MPVEHYENFPVASLLLPRRLQRPVEDVYRFARAADDLADEGDAAPAERQSALAAFDDQLVRIAEGRPLSAEPAPFLFEQLAATIRANALPIEPFRDLLSAFSQDCAVSRYEDDPALLDYCRRSANPVGRIMLFLYGADSERHRRWSDLICTALQWINFWQDVAIDLKKDRIYLPRADRERFGVSEAMLFGDPVPLVASPSWKALMRHEVLRSRAMIVEGAPLATTLTGRIGLELRLVVQGGLRILEKIERVDGDVFFQRPTLGKTDAVVMFMRAFGMPRTRGDEPAGQALGTDH